MMIDGFCDVANLAYMLDVRGSTVEDAIETGNGLVPEPVKFCEVVLWPMPAIRQWFSLGCPMHWEYDTEEYSLLAWQEHAELNDADLDARLGYANQRKRALTMTNNL